jgi:hypothetical protein
VDNQSPTIGCPGDVTVEIPSGMTGASDVTLGYPSVSDNCGMSNVVNTEANCYPVGTNVVVWTATDIHGNQSLCTQRVIVAAVTVNSSNFHMVEIEAVGDDLNLTWQTFGNTTNVIQLVSPPLPNGDYTNSYVDLIPVFVPGSGPAITNWVDSGAVTNYSTRYYRIKLQPGESCTP